MQESHDVLPLHCQQFPQDLAEAYHVEEEARNTVVTLQHMGTPWKMRIIGFAPCPGGFALNAAVVMLPPQGIPTLRSRKEVEQALGHPLAFQSKYTAVQEAIDRGTTVDQVMHTLEAAKKRIAEIGQKARAAIFARFGGATANVGENMTELVQDESKDPYEAVL